MKKASISEAKNRLSALLDRVRHGHSITIEDRGVPVARLEPVVTSHVDPDGRAARLERQGALRRPSAVVPGSVLATRPPRPRDGRMASDVVIEERRQDR
jgi:prevent-host-death family protein